MRAKKVSSRRSRPLRHESDDVVWFVTTRVTEARYWLHPLLSCGLQPRNRAARRLCAHRERHLDKRLQRLVDYANKHRGKHQPELTVPIAKRIARGLVGGAIADAQAHCNTQVFGFVVMSNHMHLLVRTRGKNLAAFMRELKAAITRGARSHRVAPCWSPRGPGRVPASRDARALPAAVR